MEPVSTTLFHLYRRTPFHNEWVAACLQNAWQQLLGEKLAAVCRPARIHHGELIIEILDRSWSSALADMNEDLLSRIQSAAGNEICSLSFVIHK